MQNTNIPVVTLAAAPATDKKNILASSGAVNNLSEEELKELWRRVQRHKRLQGTAQCWVYPNKPNQKGYIQVALSSNKKIYTHHLALRMTQGAAAIPVHRKQNVSHRCSNSACCNPDHLVLETAEQNHARKNCLVTKEVVCPCGCENMFTANICGHVPPCL